MQESRRGLLAEIYSGWGARLLTGFSVSAGAYQFACDQFGFPTVPKAWGMTGGAIPWWGWLLIGVIGAVYGLFEYVRRNLTPSTSSVEATFDESALRAELDGLRQMVGSAIAANQKALEAREQLEERVAEVHRLSRDYAKGATDGINDRIAFEAMNRTDAIQGLTARVDEHREWIKKVETSVENHGWSFLAIWHRERMLALEAEADGISQSMISALLHGVELDLEGWHAWREKMRLWESKVSKWSDFGQFYLGSDPMITVKRIDAEEYDEEVGVRHNQIPDPEGLRVYKTFYIYYRNWMNLRATVDHAVRKQAFEGQ